MPTTTTTNDAAQPPYVEQRVQYSYGQLLQAEDFTLDQHYHIDRLRRVTGSFLSPGIIAGLEVTVSGDEIRVATGSALDAMGQLIVWGSDASAKRPMQALVGGTLKPLTVSAITQEAVLSIAYSVHSDRLLTDAGEDVPLPPGTAKPLTAETRWREEPALYLDAPNAKELADGAHIALMRLKPKTAEPGLDLLPGDRVMAGVRPPGQGLAQRSTLRATADALVVAGKLRISGELTGGDERSAGKLTVGGELKIGTALSVGATTLATGESLAVKGGVRIDGGLTVTGTGASEGALSLRGPLRLNKNDLYLLESQDSTHGLGWYGAGRPFAGQQLNGPVLYGAGGGALGVGGQTQLLALCWNAAGNVGIGTSSPQHPLQIKGNSAVLGLEGADHSYISWYPIGIGAGRKARLGFCSAGDTTLRLINESAGANIMLEPTGGHLVLAGRTANARLQINLPAGDTSATPLEALRILKPKRKLPNPHDPSQSLEIGGYSAGLLLSTPETGQAHSARLDVRLSGPAGTGNSQGEDPDVTVMSILGGNNGRVGIGTAAPNAKLEVYTGGGATASLKCEHVGSNFIIRPLSAGSSTSVIENTSGGALLINPNGGNVGIGTMDPKQRLHVKGFLALEGSDHTYIEYYPDGIANGRKAWLGFGNANDNNLTISNEILGAHIVLQSNAGKVSVGGVLNVTGEFQHKTQPVLVIVGIKQIFTSLDSSQSWGESMMWGKETANSVILFYCQAYVPQKSDWGYSRVVAYLA
jgi:hypothetical protein